MIIIPEQLSTEITSKYSVLDNTFAMQKIKNAELDKYDGKPKDEINVEIGDSKTPNRFLPQIKLCRWSNETNFSLRLIDNSDAEEELECEENKIKYKKGDIEIEYEDFEEGEGSYKMVWYLNKKPVTNKIEFTIQSKGLDFLYQPELTPEEIAEGAYRPPEVVGSYAVYHQTKGGMNDACGKEYKVGKAFHIYRPHIIDAVGNETWGILNIANGIYSVEIPQSFLDTAVYPIKSNDTFGYEGAGASSTANIGGSTTTTDDFRVRIGTASAGTVTSASVSAAVGSGSFNPEMRAAIYDSTPSLLSPQSSDTILNSTKQWWVENFTGGPTISAGTNWVVIGFNSDGHDQGTVATLYYDTGGTSGDSKYHNNNFEFTDDYSNPPSDFSSFYASVSKYSIYATYTPSGPPGSTTQFLQLLGVGT